MNFTILRLTDFDLKVGRIESTIFDSLHGLVMVRFECIVVPIKAQTSF